MEIIFEDKKKISVILERLERQNDIDFQGVGPFIEGKDLPIGAMTIDFIETNFQNPSSFQEYVDKWGIEGFVAYSDKAKEVIGFGKGYTEDEYTALLQGVHAEILYGSYGGIIRAQNEINHIAYTCLDHDGPEWSHGLTPKQRHYIMLQKWNKSMSETRNYLNSVTINYYSELDSKELRDKVWYSRKSLSESDLAKLILEDNPVFVEVYGSENIAALCLIEIKEMLANGIMIKKCKNCNRYFVNGSKEKYCDRPVYYDADGTPRTCQMIGPKKAFLDDPAKKEYSKAYRTLHNRLKKGGKYKVSKDELDFWRTEAKAKLEEVEKGNVTLDEFRQWLVDTVKNFREWIKEAK